MDEEMRIIRTEAMKQFFKDKPFITAEDYKSNRGSIMLLGGALRKVSAVVLKEKTTK